MKCLLPLVILINCLMIQGVLEWTVVGKVTEYGQNVTLFCNVPNCCPKDAGWDRWTPHQRTLFIDVKTGRSNKKYDGKVLKDGYTLIIQNFTENDLNVSYSCLYGVTLGEIKFLFKGDVFTPSTKQDVPTGLSPGEIGAIITGITMVLVLVSIFIYFRTIRSKKQGLGEGKNKKKESEDVHETEELLTNKTDLKKSDQMNIQEFQDIRTNNPLFETQPKPTEEHNLLQAAYIIIYTVPIAIEDFIDREYKGGFVQAVRDYKDQLKANIRTEEWDLLSQMIVTWYQSARLQKNYHNSNQNLSDGSNVIDSLISKGVLEPNDTPDEISSEQDYSFFLEALKEDPVSPNAELASVLESTDVNQDELNQTANPPQLTNRPGFQSLVTLVSMVKDVQISDTEPESHDYRLAADLYRLQSWYNKIIKMSSMDLDKYQQFVQTVNAVLGRISGQNDPVVKESTLNTVMQKQVKKMLHSLKEKKENSELKEKLKKMETDLGEIIPKNIRELIKKQVEDWEKKDKMFVSTRASDYVMEQLQDNSCLTLTAPSGVGKSFIARHTTLVLKRQGYNIIPVELPADIKTYYHPGKQTVFIIDDICGNFTANQQQVENWKQLLPVIKTIMADKCCKIIVSCRLQVYKDDKFNILSPFKSCECNLISDKLCLTSVEKTNIAKMYIGTSMTDIDDLSSKCDFFPLLCSLYHEKENVDVKEYFKNPFDVYKSELDRLSEHGDEGNYKICSLALCVLFNNQLNEKWFQGKMTDEQQQIIKDTCEASEFNSIPKAKLKKALDTLDGTFICKQNGIYRAVHDKLFDFLAHYFGQKMIECLIDHGDSDLVHERFVWQESSDDKNSNIDFIIKIPDDYLESYLQRFIKDWSVGKVSAVFSNMNMKVSSFRQKLLQYLLQLDKPQQVTLASTNDTVLPKEDCGSGNTPLIETCYDGYTDMVQWLLHNDVNVDHCRGDGATGLSMASQEGHTDIVKLLLEKDPNVDLCNNDVCSPLLLASNNGHTDIVKLLLEKDPNVDLFDKDGGSPLYLAIQNGHTDVVKLLLEKDPNVDLCDKNGCSPLLHASYYGHTEIVKLLLERNPNVDLCTKKGFTPLIQSCISNYTSIVQLLMKHKPDIDAQTYDGANALYFSAWNGNVEIMQLLLEKDPNVDLCTKKGFTPLIQSCLSNHTSIVQLLMKHKPNINAQTFDGGNALYFSARNGNVEIMQLLLENNADCNICGHSKQKITDTLNNDSSRTLDEYKQGLYDDFLVKSNVRDYTSKKSVDYIFDVDAGSSPLHIACFMGRIGVVCCLLDHNANINITKEDRTTPLFFACEVGHEDIVCLLLDKGADTQICRLDGESPLNIARDNGHASVEIMLTNHTKEEDKLSS